MGDLGWEVGAVRREGSGVLDVREDVQEDVQGVGSFDHLGSKVAVNTINRFAIIRRDPGGAGPVSWNFSRWSWAVEKLPTLDRSW